MFFRWTRQQPQWGTEPRPLQAGRVRADEWIAIANHLNDREQPLQDDVIQRNCDEAERGDRAQAHDQPLGFRRKRDFENAHDPLLVRGDEQHCEHRGAHQPVHDDEDPHHGVRDRKRAG